MVMHAVMRAWHVSRQQFPSTRQELPRFSSKPALDHGLFPQKPAVADRHEWAQPPLARAVSDAAVDDDAPLHVTRRDKIVPVRRGAADRPSDGDGFWSSHLFWKGIVLGVLAVVFIKTVLAVQTPFGIDWYGF
jgi:hypothetical protein